MKDSTSLNNPLAVSSITDLLLAILNVVVIIAIPIVVLFLIYAGFLYVVAQGNAEKITEASKALMYGIIGGVIIIGSYAITTIIKSTASSFGVVN